MLTKIDIAALRQADFIVVRLDSNNPEGSITVTKRAEKTERNPFADDIRLAIPGKVSVTYPNKAGTCFSMVDFYHSQMSHASSIIKTLRTGDEVRFRFYPDAHTNELSRSANIHGDVLMLDVWRDGRKVAEWEFDHRICTDNTARMCKPVEYSLRVA